MKCEIDLIALHNVTVVTWNEILFTFKHHIVISDAFSFSTSENVEDVQWGRTCADPCTVT